MYGCEIVWPSPIGTAASSYERARSPSGTKSSRGTLAIASRTCSSSMPRARSWRSTIVVRTDAQGSDGMRGRRDAHRLRHVDAEVCEHRRRHLGDAGRRRVDSHGQHRHDRVVLRRANRGCRRPSVRGRRCRAAPNPPSRTRAARLRSDWRARTSFGATHRDGRGSTGRRSSPSLRPLGLKRSSSPSRRATASSPSRRSVVSTETSPSRLRARSAASKRAPGSR